MFRSPPRPSVVSLCVMGSLALSLSLAACTATVREYQPNGLQAHRSGVAPEDVLVFTEEPEEPYQVIGRVTVDQERVGVAEWNRIEESEVVELLQREASRRGADAIILDWSPDRLGDPPGDGSQGSALAIRLGI